MSPLLLAILLFAAGLALIAAELVLPGGVLGVAGALAIAGGVATCFFVDPWLGVGALGASIVLGPIAAALWVRALPRTPIARGLLLQTTNDEPAAPAPVRPGQRGVAVSDMRPGGVAEFGDVRVQAASEHGVIPAGSRVRVVAYADGRALVRREEG